jgi:hypothetical protein
MCNPKIYASKFVAFSISMNLKIKNSCILLRMTFFARFFARKIIPYYHNITQLMSYVQLPRLQIQSKALGTQHPEALFSKLMQSI